MLACAPLSSRATDNTPGSNSDEVFEIGQAVAVPLTPVHGIKIISIGNRSGAQPLGLRGGIQPLPVTAVAEESPFVGRASEYRGTTPFGDVGALLSSPRHVLGSGGHSDANVFYTDHIHAPMPQRPWFDIVGNFPHTPFISSPAARTQFSKLPLESLNKLYDWIDFEKSLVGLDKCSESRNPAFDVWGRPVGPHAYSDRTRMEAFMRGNQASYNVHAGSAIIDPIDANILNTHLRCDYAAGFEAGENVYIKALCAHNALEFHYQNNPFSGYPEDTEWAKPKWPSSEDRAVWYKKTDDGNDIQYFVTTGTARQIAANEPRSHFSSCGYTFNGSGPPPFPGTPMNFEHRTEVSQYNEDLFVPMYNAALLPIPLDRSGSGASPASNIGSPLHKSHCPTAFVLGIRGGGGKDLKPDDRIPRWAWYGAGGTGTQPTVKEYREWRKAGNRGVYRKGKKKMTKKEEKAADGKKKRFWQKLFGKGKKKDDGDGHTGGNAGGAANGNAGAGDAQMAGAL